MNTVGEPSPETGLNNIANIRFIFLYDFLDDGFYVLCHDSLLL
jgi:hypothetical protein